MLPNMEKLIAPIRKSLGFVKLDFPSSHLLGTKVPSKSLEICLVCEQVECAIDDDFITPDRIFSPQKSLPNTIQWKKSSQISGVFMWSIGYKQTSPFIY